MSVCDTLTSSSNTWQCNLKACHSNCVPGFTLWCGIHRLHYLPTGDPSFCLFKKSIMLLSDGLKLLHLCSSICETSRDAGDTRSNISLIIWREWGESTSWTVQRWMINVSCQSEMQKHLLHNIADANREAENLTERQATFTLVCYLPLAAILSTDLLLFHYFHRRYKTTPTHIQNWSGVKKC